MYLSYTYFVKNKITNQFYYGSRFGNIKANRMPIDDMWIKYFTSSKAVKSLIKEYGKDSFEVSIILQSEKYEDCYWCEQELIKEHINDMLCLNKHYIDNNTKNNIFSTSGVKCSQETRIKISKANTGKTFIEIHGEERAKILRKQKSELMIQRNHSNKGISDDDRMGIIKSNNKKEKLSARCKNKTYEEIYGAEQAIIEKNKRGIHQEHRAGKTYEEMYGVEVAMLAKQKKSESMKKTLALKRAKALTDIT